MGRVTRVLSRTISGGRSGWLLIGLGVLLMLNPLYVGALHLDEPEWYQYGAAEVRFENGTVTGPGAAALDDDDVACLDGAHRNCVLEHHVHARDDVALPHPTAAARNGGDGHTYAFVDGQFYRTAIEDRNGTTYLALDPLERERALAFASTPLAQAPDVVRRAVHGETVTTREPILVAGELVHDPETDRYYVLARRASHTLGDEELDRARTEGRIVEIALTTVLGLVGLGAILVGQRSRIER